MVIDQEHAGIMRVGPLRRDRVPDREICIIDGLLRVLRVVQDVERDLFCIGPVLFVELVDRLFAARMEHGDDLSVIQPCHLLSVPNHILATKTAMSQRNVLYFESL